MDRRSQGILAGEVDSMRAAGQVFEETMKT